MAVTAVDIYALVITPVAIDIAQNVKALIKSLG